MEVLYIVLPLALLIAVAAVTGFIWMVRGGQLDDLESPALRMLHDDTGAPGPKLKAKGAPSGPVADAVDHDTGASGGDGGGRSSAPDR